MGPRVTGSGEKTSAFEPYRFVCSSPRHRAAIARGAGATGVVDGAGDASVAAAAGDRSGSLEPVERALELPYVRPLFAFGRGHVVDDFDLGGAGAAVAFERGADAALDRGAALDAVFRPGRVELPGRGEGQRAEVAGALRLRFDDHGAGEARLLVGGQLAHVVEAVGHREGEAARVVAGLLGLELDLDLGGAGQLAAAAGREVLRVAGAAVDLAAAEDEVGGEVGRQIVEGLLSLGGVVAAFAFELGLGESLRALAVEVVAQRDGAGTPGLARVELPQPGVLAERGQRLAGHSAAADDHRRAGRV